MHASTTTSPYARWHALPLRAISLTEGFWSQKQAVNRQVSLRHGYERLEQAGNFNNLRLAAGAGDGEYRTPVFMDSDVYKWLEAVAYDLANVRDPEVERMAGEAISLISAAQQADGYLNSYYQVTKPDERWTDLDHDHEMYCAGHLFEAAVAMHRATGDERLLGVACRFADHIDSIFGPGRRDGTSGHPEIELALVELYRETSERRYLDLAGFFVSQRGKGRMSGYGHFGPEYHQDRVPVREATIVEGHAVRQLYLTTGVTDIYLETGEQALFDAMTRLWHDMTTCKMHITAGFGAQPRGEAFGSSYDLPTEHCYCETCAAIAGMMWNWRMLLATGEACYADLLERSLYNGFLSGVSLDGRRYFYVNVLQSRGGIERPEWYGCACCPPNVMRQIAVVSHYVATTDETGVQIHQYMPALVKATTGSGSSVMLRIETRYPWDGHVRVTVEQTDGSTWNLALRVPGWCEGAGLTVNREGAGQPAPGSYAQAQRAWQAGDIVELDLPMPPRLTESHPRVDAVRSSLAIERGPMVCCLESADQEPGLDLSDVRITPDARIQAGWQESLLGGVVAVEAQGAVVDVNEWEDRLYRSVTTEDLPQREVLLKAVPYYAWANRGPSVMRVWIPRLPRIARK